MALHFEPYLNKKGAISVDTQKDYKRFVDFIKSSSLVVGHFAKLIDNSHKSYTRLETMMYDVTNNSNFKMWGAVEILYPAVISNIRDGHPFGESFIKTLKDTDSTDVRRLNKAREYKWRQSKKPFKNQYEHVPGTSIYNHYTNFMKKNPDNKLITTWCNEILLGLPCAELMFFDIKSLYYDQLENKIPKKWETWMETFPDYTVGQLADFLIVALYKYSADRYCEF